MKRGRTLVIGAGLAGMSAARALVQAGREVLVAEARPAEGGLARGCGARGFIHDLGPHYFFSSLADKVGIGRDWQRIPHREEVRLGGKSYPFPFGLLRRPDFLLGAARARLRRGRPERSLADFLTDTYGAAFRDRFAAPLFEKWTGRPADQLSAAYRQRLLPPAPRYLLYSLWQRLRGYTEDYFRAGRFFVYPPGGMGQFCAALKEKSGAIYHFNCRLTGLSQTAGQVQSAHFENPAGGLELAADFFLSTIPLPQLAALLEGPVWQQYRRLLFRHLRVLFLTIDRPRLLHGQWQWFPEPRYPFYRIGENSGVIPGLAPPGQTLLTVELASDGRDAPWCDPLETWVERIAPFLQELYGVPRREISAWREDFATDAYPVLLRSDDALTAAIGHATPLDNLFLAGRSGRFQYLLSEEAYDDGREAAKLIDRAAGR